MQLFYSPDLNKGLNHLGEEESHHCARVLRLSEGDRITVTDGTGHMAEGILTAIHHKRCDFQVENVPDPLLRHGTSVHVAIAPTKSQDRFEWFLEKSVELGIARITPVFCRRSERTRLNTMHARKVMISALKQSLQAWLPSLGEPVIFEDFIIQKQGGQKFIAWCESEDRHDLVSVFLPGKDAIVLIGPEGDFTENEVSSAIKAGYKPVSLGDNRLRTETAGLAALLTISVLDRLKNV